jgi:hypothetical protein
LFGESANTVLGIRTTTQHAHFNSVIILPEIIYFILGYTPITQFVDQSLDLRYKCFLGDISTFTEAEDRSVQVDALAVITANYTSQKNPPESGLLFGVVVPQRLKRLF